ncbi:MAG: hypothetical protein ACLU3I_12305 [Acutalibacteraceae bacterium]
MAQCDAVPTAAVVLHCKGRETTLCYGVKTGCDCFAFFQLDCHGVTLFLNLMSGAAGTDVKVPFTACVVTETVSTAEESVYDTAKRFMHMLCEKPVLPKTPVFGVNNWYWAYGSICDEGVLREADYLAQMTDGVKNRPSLVIDDGWQINRTTQPHYYIGGRLTAAMRNSAICNRSRRVSRRSTSGLGSGSGRF